LLNAAEVDVGASTGFLRRHASGNVGCDGVFDVKPEFVIELAGMATLDEKAQAGEES
jgi:hypothetical protein